MTMTEFFFVIFGCSWITCMTWVAGSRFFVHSFLQWWPENTQTEIHRVTYTGQGGTTIDGLGASSGNLRYILSSSYKKIPIRWLRTLGRFLKYDFLIAILLLVIMFTLVVLQQSGYWQFDIRAQ